MPEHDPDITMSTCQQALNAQAAAANPAYSAWVEANAGSGKTRVLIDRVARLLLPRPDGRPGARPDSILCITYTKAAANEMLSRLFDRLGHWTVADDQTLRRTLSDLEQRDPATYTAKALREARCLFARALETPGGIRIETIHAFCTRILRRFPLEAGVPPGFTTIEEVDADALWQDVLRTHLTNNAESFQKEIATLAEATGGHGVMAALNALRSEQVNMRAFARRLPGESAHDRRSTLEDRLQTALRAPEDSLETIYRRAIDTDNLPRESIKRVRDKLDKAKRGASDDKLLDGLNAVLGQNTPARRYQAYMDAIAGTNHDFPSKSNPYTITVSNKVDDIVTLYARKADDNIPQGLEITRMKAVQAQLSARQTADRTIALLVIGLPAMQAFQKAKTARAWLDFDDLVECTYRLLHQSSAAEWVLFKLDGGLSHILLDEAQDTSPSQWQLINALVEEMRAGAGYERDDEPRTQFTVGDPKQSIYSFQGANAAVFKEERLNFEKAEHVLAKAQDRLVNMPKMLMSFRSSPEILHFVDAMLNQHMPMDDETKAHWPFRYNQPGRVELWPLEMPAETNEQASHWSAPVDYVAADDPRRRLAKKVAIAVREMIDGGETVWREQADRSWQRTPVTPKDILILVRRRNNLFEALVDSLKQQDLPVAGVDRLHLLDTLGVQDCLNLLRFALQPDDDLTLAEILRGPFCGLTDDDRHLFVLAHARPKAKSLWSQLQSCRDPLFAPAKTLCGTLLDNGNLSAFDFLNAILTHRGTDGLNGLDRLVQRLGEPVREPVNALLTETLGHDMTEPASLQNFLHRIESRDIVLKRELSAPDGTIRVMTVHGAKGLQAPVVILPDTADQTKMDAGPVFFTKGGIPLYSPSSKHDCNTVKCLREAANTAAEHESCRLLYVAMTRASDRLVIAGTGTKRPKTGYTESSWYGHCLATMRTLTGQNTDQENNPTAPKQKYTLGPEPHIQKRSTDTPENATSAPDWLTRPAPALLRPVKPVAPSRLGDHDIPVAVQSQVNRADALHRGRTIHDLLRILPDIEPAMHEHTIDTFLSGTTTLTDMQAQEIRDTILKTLRHPDCRDIFSQGGRNEVPIVGTLPDGQVINGRIDRLVTTGQTALIVDYKTDRPAPRNADHVSVSSRAQMAAYRAIVNALYGGRRTVECALLYTDGPVLIRLPPGQT